MADKAKVLAYVPEAPKKTVMLLGYTGTGKSSTTNSFVDDLYATKAGASGESCTCVPTLLVYSLAAQVTRYAAELYFFSREVRKDFLLEQVQNYNRYNFAFDEAWEIEQKTEFEALAETALKILRALLNTHFEFSSPGNIKVYLGDRASDAVAATSAIDRLCQNLLPECDGNDAMPMLRFDSDDPEELNDMIKPYIFEQEGFESPALWPLIDHVRKGLLGCEILKQTNILDLPGTADTNRVRAQIANKFIKDSDGLWLVTTIDRALSDGPLDAKLATYGERFGSNVVIIATKSDAGADDQLARELAEKGAQPSCIQAYWDYSQQIRDPEARKSSLVRSLRPKGNKRRRTMSSAEEADVRRMKDELDEKLRQVENEQLDLLIDLRCSRMNVQLKHDKQKYLAAGAELSVFCVSNTHYSAHKAQTGEKRMNIEATNIPALRNYAREKAAPGNFATIDNYVNSALTLLKGAELWAVAATVQRRQTLMRIARQPAELHKVFLQQWLQTTTTGCDQDLIGPLIAERPAIISAALLAKSKFARWHHSIGFAFFRNNGKHSTPQQSHTVWNEHFTEKQTAELDASWFRMLDEQKETLERGLHKVIKALSDIPEQLNSLPAATPIPIEPLQGIVDACGNRIRTTHATRAAELQKVLVNIRLDATRDVPTAYFTNAMSPMYDECNDETGTGKKDRQWATLESWLRGRSVYNDLNSPFEAVTRGLAQAFKDAVKTTADKLHRDIGLILYDMSQSFELAIRQQAQGNDEERARQEVKSFMVRNQEDIEKIGMDLSKVKQKYGLEESA